MWNTKVIKSALSGILIVFSQFAVIGQSIQITTVLDQVIESQTNKNEFVFEAMEILFSDLPNGDPTGINQYLEEHYSGNILKKNGSIVITNNIKFINCSFSKELVLNSIHFNDLTISNSELPGLLIDGSRFDKLQLDLNNIKNSVEIKSSVFSSFTMDNNVIEHDVYLENDTILVGDVSIENNKINKGELALSDMNITGSVNLGSNIVSGVFIENSRFNMPEYGEFNNYQLPGTPSADLYLINNIFEGDSTARVMYNKGNYLNLVVQGNKFFVNVYFIENRVDERFFLVDNEFNRTVSFEKFLFSEIWNELYWDQLSGYKLRYGDYGMLDSAEITDNVKFKNLINIYKGMHTIFLSRGDLQSANACYSEMKQLQGKMLKNIYLTQSGFNNFFRWQLNMLLKVYTNHGTDPALAVIMSFYVIFIFAVLYLFFPSEWDENSKNRLLVSYEKLLSHKGKGFYNPVLIVTGSVLLTLVNSITLSINSFVTLGFGRIPTKGFARYLCIIEGFIGWFLLSIFTVALINQVLA